MSHLAYGHRSLGVPSTGRAGEYLENLKNEFESMTHEINMYKMQRDDFERKLTAQLNEFANFQQTLYDLEKNHQRIKTQYEEEIMRLRRQIENNSSGMTGGGGGAGGGASRDTLSSPLAFRPGSPVPSTGASPLAPRPPAVGSQSGGPAAPGLGDKNVLAPPEKSRGAFTSTAPGANSMGGSGNNVGGLSAGSGGAGAGSGGAGGAGSGGSAGGQVKRQRSEGDFYPGQQGSFPPLNASPAPGEPKTKVEKRDDIGLPLPGFREKEPPRTNTMDMLKDTDRRPEDDEGKDKNGADWIVGYNPGVQTNLNIDLMHNLNHSSVVCCVKFSSDGKYLATGCNKSAQIYDVDSGRKVHTFIDDCVKDGDLYIRSVCFSPDGQHLATACAEDKTVKVWDITHKRILHTFTGHELDIYSLDFSQDGRFIVSGSGDKKAKIWDIEKGRCAFTLGNEEVGPKDGVTSVAISPDGRLVAAGSLDRIVRLWDAQTGYFLERYEGHADSVYSVAFSPDGKSLASGSLDKTLKLWDLSGSRARSRCRSTFNGHKDFVLSVAFSPDGNWLISGSKDRSVQFWDPRSAVTHMMLQGHKNSVISVALSPAGGVFATGSGDYRARLWKYEA